MLINEQGKEMNSNLLLIAPLFFDYYKEIKSEAELLGFNVDYICDAPSNSNFSKAVGRINKRLIKGATERYFQKDVIPWIVNKKYDYILVVGGMTFAFTPEMVGKIRAMNPDAVFILYQWDSEKNLPYATGIHKYFNRIYSFDLKDCEKKDYYTFLPLFYTRKYEEIGAETVKEYKYDCSYIGTAHPQKFKDINMMTETLKKTMPSQFIYHYMPSKFKYLYHKLLAPEFRKARFCEFQSEKIEDIAKIFKESMCILDAPQAGQTGLTMRTIECLGAKRKLITTNKTIKNYDFYNERNILVYDGNIDFSNPFFTEEYLELDESVYKKYSLRAWISFMLN